jgi:hypothetical protein
VNVRRLFPFALFVLLFAVAVQPTIDPDMWWHLRTGEAILRDGIPHHDLFSFTYPTNEWVTHEWLSQVAMWGLYKLGGFNGPIVFFAAVTTVTWWLVYLLSEGKPYVAGMVVAVAAKASQVVWGSRPQLFNLLLLAVFVFLLERRKAGSVGRWVYVALPAITLVWANLHSGYVLGIVVLATYLVGEYLERRRAAPDLRTLPSADLVPLGSATVAAAVAALANPNGWRLWIYPFETLGSSVQREYIVEWFPPGPDQLIFWLTLGLVLVGIFGFVKSSRRPSMTELLMFGGTAVGAFLSVRNIPIFAIVATPILCRHLVTAMPVEALVSPEDDGDLRRIPTLLAGVAIGVAAFAIAGSTLADNATTVRNTFPEAAVDWIESGELEDERLFNAYGWGGYLIWRGFPVYIDGRADVYGDAGLLNFGQTWHVDPGWEEPLDRYGVGLVLVPRVSRLAGTLVDSPDWALKYEDGIARVFGRAG